MKNRRSCTILFISLILILSSGCLFPGSAAPASPDPVGISAPENNPPAGELPEKDEAGDDDSVAQIVDSPVVPPEIVYPTLGSISFDADSSTTASAEFLPGRETVLELTDAAGLTWTLTIPMNALDRPQSVTMTALSNASSQDVPGSLLGGLLLEPDGLEFYAPAVLTVTGDGAVSLPFLLTGQNDGTGIEVAFMEEAPGAASISHFSTVFLSQMDQEKMMEEMYKKLDDSEKAVIKEAKELLKNKNITVPTPPSTPLECTSKDEAKAYAKLVEEFVKAVYQPEGELIGKLLSIKRGKQLLGRETDMLFTLENRLMARLVKKVRLLINTYHGQEETLNAVSTAALRVAKDVALLSSATGESEVLFLDEISSWAESLIDELLEDIRTEHNYRKISAVWKMAYWASLLSGRGPAVEEIQAKMERVLQFQMKLNWEMGIEGESNYVLQGEFPMRYLAKEVQMGSLIGSGKAEMISAKFESDEDWYVESAPFHVKAIITGFDPCRSTAYLTVNRFYPNVENHFTLDSDGEVMEIGPMALMQIAWETLYEDRKRTGLSWYAAGEVQDYYNFELQLRNKDVTAVNDMIETMDMGEAILMGWFSVDLTHTPR